MILAILDLYFISFAFYLLFFYNDWQSLVPFFGIPVAAN